MEKDDCVFCKLVSNRIDYYGNIKNYKYWRVIISREQHTLSTLIILLKRHLIRFSSIDESELLELNKIQKEMENVLDNLFKPNLYNYLQCGNATNHLHIHLIPRYKEERIFAKKKIYRSSIWRLR